MVTLGMRHSEIVILVSFNVTDVREDFSHPSYIYKAKKRKLSNNYAWYRTHKSNSVKKRKLNFSCTLIP